jgi:hypothetical protein
MKKIVVMMALLALAAAPAMATTVRDDLNPGSELDLYQVVNAVYFTTYGSSAAMLFAQLDPLGEVFSGEQDYAAEAKYAGYEETFGWYQETGAGNPTDLNELFSVPPGTSGLLGGSPSGTISPVGDYGFYLEAGPSSNPDRYTWFSERDENRRDEDHMVTYDLELLTGDTAYHGCVLLGWEDKPFWLGQSDKDYEDLVVQLCPADKVILPEPATILLLGMGLAGMTSRYLKRSRKIL